MNLPVPDLFSEHYEWRLMLYAVGAIVVLLTVGKYFLYLIPTMKYTQRLNKTAAKEKMARDFYVRIQQRSVLWGGLLQVGYFALVMPFLLTAEMKLWWRTLLDIFAIMMVYDFFYYVTHRFLFHAGPLGGPLMWMHAVHHQQKNPCRLDSNYLHPLETCIGLALYGGTVALLAALMGDFQVVTIVVTYVLFLEINQHNHDLVDANRFPFKYLYRASYLHHIHHAKFTGGNFGTISQFYDWLFGTCDNGSGWGKKGN